MIRSLSPFQTQQLGITLRNAVRHPFYEKHWHQGDGVDLLSNPAVALKDLPVVYKEHLDGEIQPVLEEGDEIVGVSFSSGSTGRIVSRFSTLRERQMMADLLSSTVGKPSSRVPIARKSIHLEFLSSWHGVTANSICSQGSITLPGNAADEIRIKRTLALMQRCLVGDGIDSSVSSMSGGITAIYSFTRYLQDKGVDPSQFSLKVVGVFGGYLGDRRRSVIESYWQCPVVDSFSVSECRGKAFICPRCGHLSFEPQLVPQVIALDSEAVVDRGIGRLVLTELYPFGIAQPLVKYVTGDLVEIIPAGLECSEFHRHGLRRLGRVESSLFLDARERRSLLLASQEIYDIFDRVGVCRDDPDSSLRLGGENDLGQPHVLATVTCRQRRATVTISYKPDDSGVNAKNDLNELIADCVRARAARFAVEVSIILEQNSHIAAPMAKFG